MKLYFSKNPKLNAIHIAINEYDALCGRHIWHSWMISFDKVKEEKHLICKTCMKLMIKELEKIENEKILIHKEIDKGEINEIRNI